MNTLRKEILDLMRKSDRAWSPVEMAKSLKLKAAARKRIQKELTYLVKDGEIVKIRGNRYSLAKLVDLVSGRLAIARSGNGFVTMDSDGTSVFVPKHCLETALPGDQVLVRLDAERQFDDAALGKRRRHGDKTNARASSGSVARPTGKVIKIVERTRKDIVGTLETTGRFLHVVPIDPVYTRNFYVPTANGAKPNDRVVMRFASWENTHVNPEAEIVAVLGPADNPSVDTISIIKHFGLETDFGEPVLREAESCSILVDSPGDRIDLRDEYVITIDPDEARDFDDALSLRRDSNGNQVLGVHIADVSHFVRPKSMLDREALRRGNSVYLPDKVIPMLPEQLSNGVCSLRPNEDRLTFSVFLTLDKNGRIIGRAFAKTIIRSRKRLTYKQAMSAITTGEKTEHGSLLAALHTIAQQLRHRRFAKHALRLDMDECRVVLDQNGCMTGIEMVINDESHQLVEECMIAANEAVAAELSNRGVPVLSRLHESPAPEKIEELTHELAAMGYDPGDLNTQRNLADFLASVSEDALAYHIQMAVLRSMKRAEYSVLKSGHYGLAKKYYVHFTSPIRRYPDLVVHRILSATLTGKSERIYTSEVLQSVAVHCSQTEQVADEAERSLEELKKLRFLQQQLNDKKPVVYSAVVTAVMNFGIAIDVPQIQAQGFVHVSNISNRFVRYSKKDRSLRAEGKSYRLGTAIKVCVVKVDMDKRQIDFATA
ncbi:MAG: ribonuclease R [Lentisphaerae bacterium]|nr:ribonuclease R [Lentisphaerota bacterium]